MGKRKPKYSWDELINKLAQPEPQVGYLKNIRSAYETHRIECLGDLSHRMIKVYYSDGKHEMIEYIGSIRI